VFSRARSLSARLPRSFRQANCSPPAERRRYPIPVKLALAVGQEAFQNAGRDAANTATVFTSSSGEGETLHQMCEALASAEREVSPTRFHKFRAQRRCGLLEHRDALAGSLHQPVRLLRELQAPA